MPISLKQQEFLNKLEKSSIESIIPFNKYSNGKLIVSNALPLTTHSPIIPPNQSPILIETHHQFMCWFAGIEKEMEQDSLQLYLDRLDSIVESKEKYNNIIKLVEKTLELLNSLLSDYTQVNAKTRNIQDTCQRLLQDQVNHQRNQNGSLIDSKIQLSSVLDDLNSNLEYFMDLDPITRLLNMPAEKVCRHGIFIPTLKRLDTCIAYLEQHPEFNDTPLYLMKYRQCMSRGLSLIRVYFIGTIRSLIQEIRTILIGYDPKESLDVSIKETIFYVKFVNISSFLQPLIGELEERSIGSSSHTTLLQECTSVFFASRVQLLKPFIIQETTHFPTHDDLIGHCKSFVTLLQGICVKEYTLFRIFFRSQTDEFMFYIDTLCTPFLESLRPVLLNEQRIELLSELYLYLTSIANTISTTPHEDNHMLDESEEALGFVLDSVIQDVQGRLVFRAEAFIKSELNFIPRDNEIIVFARISPVLKETGMSPDYSFSESLKRRSVNTPTTTTTTTSSINQKVGMKYIQGGGDYFPSVNKLLWTLCIIYKCIPQKVFEGIAQEGLGVCHATLIHCMQRISLQTTRLDGNLFYLKHLAYLREELDHLFSEIEYKNNEHVLGIEGVLKDIYTRIGDRRIDLETLSDFSINFGKALNTPSVSIGIVNDTRSQIESAFKKVFEDVLLEVSMSSLEPITTFNLKVSAFKSKVRTNTQQDVTYVETLFSIDRIKECYNLFLQFTQLKMKTCLLKIIDYLQVDPIRRILEQYVTSSILDHYNLFLNNVTSHLTREESLLVEFKSIDELEADILEIIHSLSE